MNTLKAKLGARIKELRRKKALEVEMKELFDFDYLEKSDKELINAISSRLNGLNKEQLRVIYRLIEIL